MIKKTILAFTALCLLTACQTVNDQHISSRQIACTKEAKLCPDGSSVGRTGPNCEFETCPGAESQSPIYGYAIGWKTAEDEKTGASFKYPEALKTTYTKLLTDEEFPHLTILKGDFSCEENASRNIDGQLYCVKIDSSAAAGSNYTLYTYTTPREDRLISLIITLQQVNCGNYDESQKDSCEKEQAEFNPDDLAVQILNTVNF